MGGPLSWLRRRVTHPRESNAAKPTQTDLDMMRHALELARAAAHVGEVPVGAVVYHTATGKHISEAHNTRESTRDPIGHAEFIAIRHAAALIGDWRLNEYTVVVTLEPCLMCAGLLINARVGRLVYGALDPRAGAIASLYHVTGDTRLNHRVESIGGVCAEEAADLLRRFFLDRRITKPRL